MVTGAHGRNFLSRNLRLQTVVTEPGRRTVTSREDMTFLGLENMISVINAYLLRDGGTILEQVVNSNVLKVDMQDLLSYCKDEALIEAITLNAERFENVVSGVACKLCEELGASLSTSSRYQMPCETDRVETLLVNPVNSLRSIRELSANDLGSLISIRGIVTRVSEVKPMLEVASYFCYSCGSQSQHNVHGLESYSPRIACTTCSSKIQPHTRNAVFSTQQDLLLQEISENVPVGHTPRSILGICRGRLTRLCAPGDIVSVTAIYIPRATSKKVLETALKVTEITKEKSTYSEIANRSSMEMSLDEVADSPDVFSRLSSSIAPEIFGHDDVKKALLLQLVSGVTRVVEDTAIRGDIHVCLVGDPGLAKSQFLKYISRASPRGIYTTGKGSSGVGLTASIVRDPMSAQVIVETGALVLADGGVCAIDEFDKMDDQDRTALHEVMEQQTVSISKAGLNTMLNARSSVLAAANPVSGRYKQASSFEENINFPNSLLSRFDLIFLLLDSPCLEGDLALARHVTYVHRYLKSPEAAEDMGFLSVEFLRYYIAQAKQFEPFVSNTLANSIVDYYVERRQEDACRMTARQLLSVIRLAQALARLRFDITVNRSDFEEATRLCKASKRDALQHRTKHPFVQDELTSKTYKVSIRLRKYYRRYAGHSRVCYDTPDKYD